MYVDTEMKTKKYKNKIKAMADSLKEYAGGLNRNKVIRIAVKFLILMLVLTILSRVANGITLTKVSVTTAESKTIIHQVSGQGEVKARQELAAGANLPDLVIETVYVNEGETVKKGGKLYKLDEGVLNEIISTKQQEINLIDAQIKEMSNQVDEEGNKVDSAVSPEMKMEKDTKAKELNKYQDLKDCKGVIRLPKKGIINTVNAVPGGAPSASDIIYSDISSGVYLEAQFSIDDKEYVKKGAEVSIIGSASGEGVDKLKLTSIKTSSDDPAVITAVIPLPEDSYDAGDQLDVLVKSASKTSGLCLPREAVHEDGSGSSFIYIVTESETVLGTQYKATRLSVDVTDRDNADAALDNLDYDQLVIIDSSRDLEDGMKIRITEGMENEGESENE